LAHSLAPESSDYAILAPSTSPLDPDLARLVAAWPDLSATAKRMILAALEADRPGAQGRRLIS
jgi:hypothetical protein